MKKMTLIIALLTSVVAFSGPKEKMKAAKGKAKCEKVSCEGVKDAQRKKVCIHGDVTEEKKIKKCTAKRKMKAKKK